MTVLKSYQGIETGIDSAVMNSRTETLADLIQNLTDDERTLLDSNSEIVTLTPRYTQPATLAPAKEACETLQRKTIESARAAEKALGNNPCKTIGSAFFVGFVLGFILTRPLR